MLNLIKNKKNLLKLFDKFKHKNVLIISGKNSFPKKILKKITVTNKLYVYFKKNKDPEFKEFVSIRKIFLKLNPDIIIGIGGGSVLDLTKVIFASKNIKKPKDIFKKKLPTSDSSKKEIILFPTTAGSGAEATNFSVMYFKKKNFLFHLK